MSHFLGRLKFFECEILTFHEHSVHTFKCLPSVISDPKNVAKRDTQLGSLHFRDPKDTRASSTCPYIFI